MRAGLTSMARSVAGGAADTGPSSTIFWCRLCTEQSLLCTLATLPCLRGGTPPHAPCLLPGAAPMLRWRDGIRSGRGCRAGWGPAYSCAERTLLSFDS